MRVSMTFFCALLLLTSGTAHSQTSAQKPFKGGNVTIEAGYLTGFEKIPMIGGAFAIVAGRTFNEHFFLGGGLNINALLIDDYSCV